MERSVRPQRTLSKQAEIDEDEEIASPETEVVDCDNVNNNNNIMSNNYNSTGNAHSNAQHRSRSTTKVKLLVRSHAMREETSPPPDPEELDSSEREPDDTHSTCNSSTNTNDCEVASSLSPNESISCNTLAVTKHPRLLKDCSSRQGSVESAGWSPSMSRGSSTEQCTDTFSIDLDVFIVEVLNRNKKDRILMLKIEQELINLAKDPKKTRFQFPQMSSYQRMLVHRAAAYFGMDHNVDSSGHCVVVNVTKTTRIPEHRFRQLFREDVHFAEEPRRSILKRDSASFEETGSLKSSDNANSRRSKSFEEREEEYEEARRRIFSGDEGSLEELVWSPEGNWQNSEAENTNGNRTYSTNFPDRSSARLLKIESYESKDTLRANSLRLTVSKSYSFGGYDDTQPAARVLVKQDSGSSMNSSRLSPSSSGYKSQSQRSDTTFSATPSPTATPNLSQINQEVSIQNQTQESISTEEDTVMWAVTNISSVPAGSVLINPQNGEPYTNSDGSIYHFDPQNPPKVEVINSNSDNTCINASHDGLTSSTPKVKSLPEAGPPSSDNSTVTHQVSNEPAGIHHGQSVPTAMMPSPQSAAALAALVHLPGLMAPAPAPAPIHGPPAMGQTQTMHMPFSHFPNTSPICPFPNNTSYSHTRLVIQPQPTPETHAPPAPPLIYTTQGVPLPHAIPHAIPDTSSERTCGLKALNYANSPFTRNNSSVNLDGRTGSSLFYWQNQFAHIQGQPVCYAPNMPQIRAPYMATSSQQGTMPPSVLYRPVHHAHPERHGGLPQSPVRMYFTPRCNTVGPSNTQGPNPWAPCLQTGPPFLALQYSGTPTPPAPAPAPALAPALAPPQGVRTQYAVFSNGYGVNCYSQQPQNIANAVPCQPPLAVPLAMYPPIHQVGRAPGPPVTSPGFKQTSNVNPSVPQFDIRMSANTNHVPPNLPTCGNKSSTYSRKQKLSRPAVMVAPQSMFSMQTHSVPGYLIGP